jgi:nucleoside-diphosphate-sugar epimerase
LMVTRGDNTELKSCIVTGATTPVGKQLVTQLIGLGSFVHAIGRGVAPRPRSDAYAWHQYDLTRTEIPLPFAATTLFHVASIWLLPDRIKEFYQAEVRRVIAFSSTSRWSKEDSSSPAERSVADSLARSEDSLIKSCEQLGIVYTIFRPTLIYGAGRDRNVADIARFARRFGVFPILGNGSGLRQPVHYEDLAQACVQAVKSAASFNRSYDLSGGETLTYRLMIERVFQAMGKRPRIVSVPESIFQLAIQSVRLLPKYHHLKPEMAKRMDRDLCFDHLAATQDLSYAPRGFSPDSRALGLQ